MFSSSTSNWYDLVVENFDRTVYGRKNKANFWMKLAVENEKKKKEREKKGSSRSETYTVAIRSSQT